MYAVIQADVVSAFAPVDPLTYTYILLQKPTQGGDAPYELPAPDSRWPTTEKCLPGAGTKARRIRLAFQPYQQGVKALRDANPTKES
jgi:hypothetical protein